MTKSKQTSTRIIHVAYFFAVVVALMMGGGLYKIVTLKIAPPSELLEVSTPLSSVTKTVSQTRQLARLPRKDSRSE